MTETDTRERLKKRLFESISTQIDAIGYVPDDILRLVGSNDLGGAGQVPGDGRAETPVAKTGEPAPTESQPDKERLASAVNSHYDEVFYRRDEIRGMLLGETEYRNIGYWDETTTTQKEACDRLQDALPGLIPEKTGRILDVACGMGASTRRLLKHYRPEEERKHGVWGKRVSVRG